MYYRVAENFGKGSLVKLGQNTNIKTANSSFLDYIIHAQ